MVAKDLRFKNIFTDFRKSLGNGYDLLTNNFMYFLAVQFGEWGGLIVFSIFLFRNLKDFGISGYNF